MKPSNRFLAKKFESFSFSLKLFEASIFSQIPGIPMEFIKKIHTKPEHFSQKYPRRGHMYKGGTPLPMDYQYFQPGGMKRSAINKLKQELKQREIEGDEYEMDLPTRTELPTPEILSGARSTFSPYERGNIKDSPYKDLAWYLIAILQGKPIRLLIHDENRTMYMYIYSKSLSADKIPGDQFSFMFWSEKTKSDGVLDLGFGEMVNYAADRGYIREAHKGKGGNTTGKIEEFIKSLTAGAPSKKNKLYVYSFPIQQEGIMEPRELRGVRSLSTIGTTKVSTPVIAAFADRFGDLISSKADNTISGAEGESSYVPSENVPRPVIDLANELGVNPSKLFLYLFKQMRDFRQALFEQVKSHSPANGFDLDEENSILGSPRRIMIDGVQKDIPFTGDLYQIEYKGYDPDEEDTGKIGDKIKKIRTRRGLLLSDVANALGISAKDYNKIEKNVIKVDDELLRRIATLFEMDDVEDILNFKSWSEPDIREPKPEFARNLPQFSTKYASIPSMFQQGSEMGVFTQFMYYLLTGKILTAKRGASELLGGQLGLSKSELQSLFGDLDIFN
jgi:transcriptional regulator with XRE-family HTH domain